MLCTSILPALHIAHPSNEWINRSFQICVCKRGRVTRKASLLDCQTSLSHLSFNGRVDWEVVLTQENKTNSGTLTLVGFSGTSERGKRGKRIDGGTPRSHTGPISKYSKVNKGKLLSRQKANIKHTSGWIIYKVVKHQKKPRNNSITESTLTDTHCI